MWPKFPIFIANNTLIVHQDGQVKRLNNKFKDLIVQNVFTAITEEADLPGRRAHDNPPSTISVEILDTSQSDIVVGHDKTALIEH